MGGVLARYVQLLQINRRSISTIWSLKFESKITDDYLGRYFVRSNGSGSAVERYIPGHPRSVVLVPSISTILLPIERPK